MWLNYVLFPFQLFNYIIYINAKHYEAVTFTFCSSNPVVSFISFYFSLNISQIHLLLLFQKMDMGPCPKVHSLQLRKEYPLLLGSCRFYSFVFLNLILFFLIVPRWWTGKFDLLVFVFLVGASELFCKVLDNSY